MPNVLRRLGTVIPGIAGLRVAIGARADRLLDPRIERSGVTQPAVDSRSRFYGAMFGLCGALLWLCASDVDRYGPVLTTLLVVFVVAGLVRIPCALRYGLPAVPVIALTALELGVPPLVLWWHAAR